MDDLLLRTSVGDFPLHEYRLALDGRAWSVLHTGAILTLEDEARFLDERDDRRPYAVVLWPAAIALAHEIAARAADFASASVLELGAGTGLPGLVAASMGSRVVQSDRQEVALSVCRRNAHRNGVSGIAYRALDWTDAPTGERFDCIIGSDIAYAPRLHGALRRLFDAYLAPGGRVLLSDPFRPASLPLFEAMERDGWSVSVSKWSIEVADDSRPVGVFELRR